MAYNQVRTKKYDLSLLFVGEFSWIWLNIWRSDCIERPEFVVFSVCLRTLTDIVPGWGCTSSVNSCQLKGI